MFVFQCYVFSSHYQKHSKFFKNHKQHHKQIYDVEENVIFNDNDVAGQTKFAFSTHMDEEEYLFCFNDVSGMFFLFKTISQTPNKIITNNKFIHKRNTKTKGGHQTNPRTVILDYEVKNDESEQAQQDILQKQNLDPLEVKARLLEMKAKDISGDYEYSREREHTHRDTNESTNERTTWMMAASLGLLAALAIGQHFYLKRYFKSHKVI